MKSNNLLGAIILLGIIASSMEWIFIEDIWFATLAMVATVIFSSFLYLKLSNIFLDIDMSAFEFVKELLKIVAVTLILISPVICFGRIIFSKEKISNPEIIVVLYILMPIVFLTLVNMIEFSPSLRKLKPVTERGILSALRQLESKLNVHIDGVYLLDNGMGIAEVNAYLVGLKKFRIFVTERLLSALEIGELVGVIAHEVAHAQRRHTLKLFLGSLFVVAIEITVALLLIRKAGIVDALIIAFGVAWFIDLILRAINRKFEYEADLTGAKIVGRDVMISALKKMSELSNSKGHTSKFSEILSDHPSIENRIKKLSKLSKLDI